MFITLELVVGLFVTVSAGGLLLDAVVSSEPDGCSLVGGFAGLD
ncbi:MAG: hypothetical protein ACREDQ_03695 [Limisphaerales bacterium]